MTDRNLKVLLVDDQRIVGETVRRMLADESDVIFKSITDPAQALATATEFQPTIILQDLVMPDVDGLTLVKFYRANPSTRDVPIVVLSSKEEPLVKAKAFAYGANDYLVKLPDAVELVARVKYHSKACLAARQRDEAFRSLAEAQKQMADELAQAARYVRSLLPKPLTSPNILADFRFIPSSQLAGDMFGYHWLDDDHFAAYLLDVSGHGVGSALMAVSAGNVLTHRSLPDTDFKNPGDVLTKLNSVFQMEKHNEKYFTIWYGVYHLPSQTLSFANAGHPSPLLYHGNQEAKELESGGFAIGMVPDWEYVSENLKLTEKTRLLLFSDGVFEIDQPNGKMWTYEDFRTFANVQSGEGLLDVLPRHARRLRGNDILNDDFSLVELRFLMNSDS